MTDQLFLSIWLKRHSKVNRVRHFEKLLRTFPFSQREQPPSVLSIYGVANTEPPLLERPVNGPVDISDVMSTLGDYNGDDVAYELESWWDLWQFEQDWKLAPSRVVLSCFGPEFDNGTETDPADQEDFRIEFGVDTNYLPRAEIPGSARMIQSNIRSLLRLVHELDSALPVDRRSLQTESGENFAERLQQVLTAESRVQ
ncbi:MAG TPA: hypothetical protein VFB14_05625 [Bryobacteraceae bacterium]|nr:hypothetical protein [Bryobacteraceae bacterium]